MNTNKKLLFYILTILLVLLPIHTFVTVWLTKEFDRLYLWSSWKEFLLLLASIVSVFYIFRDRELMKHMLSQGYNKLAVAYIALLILYLIFGYESSTTLVAFVLNVRFVISFLVAQVVGWYFPITFNIWSKALITVAVLSAIWGIAQVSILPPDALVRVGYDSQGVDTSGIPPALQKISSDSELYRAQAGLRGPNVLGAFLILPTLICLWMYKQSKKKIYVFCSGILVVCMYLTYSRSALLALLVSVIIGVTIFSKKLSNRITILLGLITGVVVVFGLMFSQTNYFQTVVLHKSDNPNIVQSNEGHVELSRQAFSEVVRSPLGEGLGSAGPASALDGQARIAENYFLQVGQEVGWLGIIILLSFHASIAVELWFNRKKDSSVVLLLALGALIITNLLLHTWSDEVVSLSFFLLAGAFIAGVNSPNQTRRHSSDESRHKSKSP